MFLNKVVVHLIKIHIMKVCSKCKVEKEYSEFYKGKTYIDGYQGNCKDCLRTYRKENKENRSEKAKIWRSKNLKKIKEIKKIYYIKNRDNLLEKMRGEYIYKDLKKWREQNPNYNKEYRKKNAKKLLEYRKTEKYKERRRLRESKRRETDLIFKLKSSVRTRIRGAFSENTYKKTSYTHELLGCDWETLKTHIEIQFTEGMNWDNRSEWHIDHIIPYAIADTKDEVEILSYYENLQPLWAIDNLMKSGSFE